MSSLRADRLMMGASDERSSRGGDRRGRPTRVLIVEDEVLIAFGLQADLVARGIAVIGPATTLAAALEHAKQSDLDGAILDVDLRGEEVFPVAEILRERGVPFVFHTARPCEQMPAAFARVPRVSKLARIAELLAALGSGSIRSGRPMEVALENWEENHRERGSQA